MRARLILVFVILAQAVSAAPPVDGKAEAKAHFRKGTALYDRGRYDEAITEYEIAYAAHPLPDILFNIGQAYRMKAERQKAVDYYEKYLDADPRGRAADEAIDHIRMLKLELEVEALRAARATLPPPQTPAPPPPAPRVEPKPAPTPSPEPVRYAPPPPAPTVYATQPAPTQRETPVYKKWWLWTIVGVVVVGGAVGAGLGVYYSQPKSFNATLPEWGPGATQ